MEQKSYTKKVCKKKPHEQRGKCKWRVEKKSLRMDTYAIHYETQCNSYYSFIEGDIKENEFRYCPYCGGRIKY